MDSSQRPEKDADAFKQQQLLDDSLATSKLIYDASADELGGNVRSTAAGDPPPSIVVNELDEHDDDEPPPYTAIAPPNHVGWPFGFSSDIDYSPCRGFELPLAGLQAPLVPSPTSQPPPTLNFHQELASGQHTSISMPLMPYRFFRFGSHRSLFLPRASPFPDNRSITKGSNCKSRRYGAILVATAVIVFLMVLSLLVRFVIETSLWRR